MAMPTILSATSIIESKIPQLKTFSKELKTRGIKPKLKVLLIGNNPASEIYVKNKQKRCHELDIDFELVKLSSTVNENEVLKLIEDSNQDPKITGFFIQFPVPNHLKHLNFTQLINPEKDVDGFHFQNIKGIYNGKNEGLAPCTPTGIINLFKHYQINIEGKHIAIIGRSLIVGKPLALMLTNHNATVTLCHSKTNNIASITKAADIIIVAIGSANFLSKDHLSDDKKQIIIDVGMNKLNDQLVGDVNFSEVEKHVKAITPVPGGVGPLTVLSLMENILIAAEKQGKQV